MAAVAQTPQGPILRLLDFVDEIVSGKEKRRHNIFILMVYAYLVGGALIIWHHFSSKDFSYICTLAGCVQCVSFYLLLHKIRMTRSVAGISSKTLQVYVLTFCFRLSSTLVKNGYLPVDKSGDWVYQASDIASLLLTLQLLFFIHKRYKDSYQAELDTFPILALLPACVLLGAGVHGELNHSPFFDKTWTIGLWFDSIAMLPQLWMLAMKGGQVEALTSNFVALTFLCRCLTWWFWLTGYPELAPKEGSPTYGGMNLVGNVIMTAQTLQLIISADFMYHYFAWQGGKCSYALGCVNEKPSDSMVLPSAPALDV